MTINWIEQSRGLLLEQAKLASPFYERLHDPEYFDDILKAVAPLEDGSVDPGDEELVVEHMLEILGEDYLASLRRGAQIQHQLSDTYEQLCKASDDEMRVFARLQLEAQFRATGLLEFFSKIAIEAKHARQELENIDNELHDKSSWQ